MPLCVSVHRKQTRAYVRTHVHARAYAHACTLHTHFRSTVQGLDWPASRGPGFALNGLYAAHAPVQGLDWPASRGPGFVLNGLYAAHAPTIRTRHACRHGCAGMCVDMCLRMCADTVDPHATGPTIFTDVL